MKNAVIETDKGPRLVDAKGAVIRAADTNRRMLHVLPKLYIKDNVTRREVEAGRVDLSVTADQPELKGLQPHAGSIQISQCLPNRGYFVGGSLDTRYGWFVELPEGLNEIDLVFHWDVVIEKVKFNRHIEHEIHLNLLSGNYQTWSMDVSAWNRVREFHSGTSPLQLQPITCFEMEDISAERKVEVMDFDLVGKGGTLIYLESVDIPPVPYSDLTYIEEFQEKQIHEIRRQTVFHDHNARHRENAIIEMPTEIFMKAVYAAVENKVEMSRVDCAEHPANKILARWWNENAPAHRCASFAMPWVRVEEVHEYWCGYYETPNEPFRIFGPNKAANARVGDGILLEFMQKPVFDQTHPNYIDVLLVNGKSSHTAGGIEEEELRSGKYDEAWYSLEALRAFPCRFPEMWESLVRSREKRENEQKTKEIDNENGL